MARDKVYLPYTDPGRAGIQEDVKEEVEKADAENSVSLYPGASSNLRERFGRSRKGELYCFARQRGPQWTHALKTTCSHGKTVRIFIVTVQREHDQLMGILLMGWS